MTTSGNCLYPFKKYKSMILMGFHRTLKRLISPLHTKVFVVIWMPADLLHSCCLHLVFLVISKWHIPRSNLNPLCLVLLALWTTTWRGTEAPYCECLWCDSSWNPSSLLWVSLVWFVVEPKLPIVGACNLYEQWLVLEPKLPNMSGCGLYD